MAIVKYFIGTAEPIEPVELVEPAELVEPIKTKTKTNKRKALNIKLLTIFMLISFSTFFVKLCII